MNENDKRIQPIINWGLLGTARINRALIRPLKNSNQNRLLGVASRNIHQLNLHVRGSKFASD